MRIQIDDDPFRAAGAERPWRERGTWPAQWVGAPGASAPFVAAFRRCFSLDQPAQARIHVSADERYELYLDGKWIGDGPERGAPERWFFESYQLNLPPGEHQLVALVWALGPRAAIAQMSVRPGFVCAAEGPLAEALTTGVAAWDVRLIAGYTFLRPGPAHWRGARFALDARQHPWGWQQGRGDGWLTADPLGPAIGHRADWEFAPHHLLHPAGLPPQLRQLRRLGRVRHVDDCAPEAPPTPIVASAALPEPDWQALADGRGPVTIAPHTARRVLFDLGDYVCAFPQVEMSGGADAQVRIEWAESLRHTPNPWEHIKGDRSALEGKYFCGFGDAYCADGAERSFRPLWWHAGRYILLQIQTADAPLTIRSASLLETRYPLEHTGSFESSDPRLAALTPLLVRGMQMCAHETFMDCPYYEELQYAGDTRLELLTSYVMSSDARLARKAIQIFDSSRLPSGLTQSRYPSRALQIIAPFAPWWAAMVADYAHWRDDPRTVRALMPGVRATIEAFERYRIADGLIGAPEGWNFVDWVPGWAQDAGAPPDAASGTSAVVNWLIVYVQTLLADLEDQLGEPEQAARLRRRAARTSAALEPFWDARRGLYADDLAHQHYSEHTQCMAILSGQLPAARHAQVAEGLVREPDLARATIYFMHYLFETYRALGRADLLLDRMQLWHGLLEQGFYTPVESPEPSRSDCHAWGSHPLFHYGATILGIRPAALGFRTVTIAPQLGPLTWASGRIPHPQGEIAVDLRRVGEGLRATITLPAGVTGQLHWADQVTMLRGGTGEYEIR